MRRRALSGLVPVALAAAAAGCGGGGDRTPTVAAAPPATLTSAADVAVCNQLEEYVGLVSQVVSNSVEAMTQSTHPDELAARTGEAQRNLTASARFIAQLEVPASLADAQGDLVAGLREFAGDFGRARKSVARNDIATASKQLVDRYALAKVTSATGEIERACGH